MKHSKILSLFLILALLPTLIGCGDGIESYFAVPKAADDYLQLQQLIDGEIARGCEYASPISGSHRQPIQLLDLDGDGTNEAVAFLRTPGGNVKITFYKLMKDGYRQVLSLTGDGTAVGGVDYADLTGDGVTDITVSWRIGTELRLLSVYDLKGWGGDVLLTTGCSEFVIEDLNGDGCKDLVDIVCEPSGSRAELYFFPDNGDPYCSTVKLSAEISELERIRACTLEGNVPALLVESSCSDGSLVSDILTAAEEGFFNLTIDRAGGYSGTRRSYAVFASDIDSDGITEVPHPVSLFTGESSESFWAISWYSYNRYGQPISKTNTYHCFSDGWFFTLPNGWIDSLAVRRDDSVPGERSVIFSLADPATGDLTDVLILYTLTGENRTERARTAGRFIVHEEDATIYAAKILSVLPEDEVKNNFHLIYTEWITGTV